MNPQPANAERRLAELGIELPPEPTPLGPYVESVQTGNLLYLSGVLPVIGHEAKFLGRLGKEYNVELQYSQTTGSAQQVDLQWSSPSTPLEDIEPVTPVGLNIDGGVCVSNLIDVNSPRPEQGL